MWTYSNPIDLRMCCAKFDQIFEVDQEFSSCLYIFTVHCYLPLEKVLALHYKKLKSSSTKDDLCQVWPLVTKHPWKMVNVFSMEGPCRAPRGNECKNSCMLNLYKIFSRIKVPISTRLGTKHSRMKGCKFVKIKGLHLFPPSRDNNDELKLH